MRRKLFSFLIFLIPVSVYSLSYDSGNFGLSSTDSITISTLTLNQITVSTMTVSSFTATGISVSTVTVSSFTASAFSASSVTVNTFFLPPTNAAPRSNVPTTAVGQIIDNTGATPDELCFSTGTSGFSWVRVSTPSLACQN
jgi:hypothetical protein